MNIFALDSNPVKAAQLQCDKHVVKMIVESAQMLSTSHRILDGNLISKLSKSEKRLSKYWELPDSREEILYKAVHVHHPCTLWTMQSNNNYIWHWIHFAALCDEYTYRYGKIHATDILLREKLKNLPINIPIGYLTKHELAMKSNPECITNNTIESYRNYYRTKSDKFKMIWTNREIPDWFVK